MLFGTAIETAIGLVVLFILVSVLASAINELIATVFSSRGRVLVQMLEQLLRHDPPATDATPLADRVLGHSLIASTGTSNVPGWFPKSLSDVKLPSYIPSRNLAVAVIEGLRNGAAAADAQELADRVKQGINALPAGDAKTTLNALMVSAGGQIDAFTAAVQNWYDDAMDRAGGVYKRQAQYALLLIGFLLAALLNIDTIRIGDALWRSPQERAALVSVADNFARA